METYETLKKSSTQPVSLLDFEKTKFCLNSLLGEWDSKETEVTKLRREVRRKVVDVEKLRLAGELEEDETFIPQRLVDSRIRQEKPAQMAFLEQPDRLLVFSDITDPLYPTEPLERAFTQFMRYEGWTHAWTRAFDGCNLHGGVCLEVRYDESKPLHCAIEYIRREDLIFSTEANSIQGNEHILRRYKYMPFELEGFVEKYGFSNEAIVELLGDSKDNKRNERIEVFKVFSKKDGVVLVSWFAPKCSKWLREPTPLDLGIWDLGELSAYHQARAAFIASPLSPIPPSLPSPLAITDYPIFFLPYELIEDDLLLSSKGRAFRDAPDQEALTKLWTSLVNAAIKASKVYAAYANSTIPDSGLSENTPLAPNTIMPKEVKYWAPPFPDARLVQVAQTYANTSAANSTRVDWAVQNRQDSGKTATEITASRQQAMAEAQSAISSQSLTFLNVYSLCWKIGQSQILAGLISGFPISPQDVARPYRLATAGDVDLTTREAKKQIIRETFQYIAGTPIASAFLSYMVETYFPERSKEWVPMLMSGDPLELISNAGTILQNIPREGLTPLQAQQLDQFTNLLSQYVQSRTSNGGSAPTNDGMAGTSPDAVANNQPQEIAGGASGTSDRAGNG